MRKISLSTLSLTHFRNYASARIETSAQPVVLTGRNGAGKTNILEGLSLLMPGRGLRRAKLSELDNQQISGLPWAVAVTLEGAQGAVKIGTGRDVEAEDTDRRIVKIDGQVIRGQNELASHVAMSWLTPQMEQLFQEGSSAGRKFLDRLVFGFDGGHATRVNAYDLAMRERNKLLSLGRADPFWLDSLERTMAENASAIASARLFAAEHIDHAIAASPLSFPKASIAVTGFVEDMLAQGQSALAAETAFLQALAEGRARDAGAGRTLVGTHRSELAVTHVEKRMPAQSCSTGEQKALLLSIILAQARIGATSHGVVPLLLLDEVVAHLDATRRLELFEEICQIGAQVWMTGTDASLFAGLQGRAQFFEVDNGKIFNHDQRSKS
jgi:DNA replication and repair protein RecF